MGGPGELECLVLLGATVPPDPSVHPRGVQSWARRTPVLCGDLGPWKGSGETDQQESLSWLARKLHNLQQGLPPCGHRDTGTHLPGAEPSGLLTCVTLQTVSSLSCRDGVPSLGACPPQGRRRGAGCGGRPESCLPGWGLYAPSGQRPAIGPRPLGPADAERQRGAGLPSVT